MSKWSGVILVIVFLCGCGVAQPIPFQDEISVQEAKRLRPQGLGYSVAVAPIRLIPPAISEEETSFWAVNPNTEELQKEMVTALKEVPVFASVYEVTNESEAKRQGAELLLQITLSDFVGSYSGTNANFIPNLFIWGLFSPLAATFVADENYRLKVQINADLTSVKTSEKIWTKSFQIEQEFSLTDWQRSVSLWDFFITMPFVTSWNTEDVNAMILPHIVQKLKAELVSRILTDVPPPKRNIAVVVGVNDCGRSSAPVLKYAEKDASELAKLLENRGFDKTILLLGNSATKTAIEDTLTNLSSRTDISINCLLFYFAGVSTTRLSKDKLSCYQSLLPYSPERTSDEIPLDALTKMTETVPATSRIVILDTGFFGKSGRTLIMEEIPASVKKEYISKIRNTEEIVFLVSCNADESSYEFGKLEHGVFTYYLLQALTEKGDINGDSVVTVEEASKTVSWPTTRYVRDNLESASQKPCAFGKALEKQIIKLK
ncbi:MAG: caspase family protein [Planctomycetota bacterium]|nr:caspase family protein [Planctomycetota bacterium]